jgi:hypothetical protein
VIERVETETCEKDRKHLGVVHPRDETMLTKHNKSYKAFYEIFVHFAVERCERRVIDEHL